jgi:hypothetical protein
MSSRSIILIWRSPVTWIAEKTKSRRVKSDVVAYEMPIASASSGWFHVSSIKCVLQTTPSIESCAYTGRSRNRLLQFTENFYETEVERVE